MLNVSCSEKIPIKLWAENLDEEAIQQAQNLANLPFAFKHIALMPDAHCGYGMPIGGVLATKGVVIPNAVGSDIGCGMRAVRTPFKDISTSDLNLIGTLVRDKVPMGTNRHSNWQGTIHMPSPNPPEDCPIVTQEWKNSNFLVGTLGGGNHFIELQEDLSSGHIWIMLHSGSRNLGNQINKHYDKLAKEHNEEWFSVVPSKHQLAFLPMNHHIGKAYLREMKWAVEYAECNRKLIMERVIHAMMSVLGEDVKDEHLDISHNYARMENHFHKNVMVHRKGAINVRKGEYGVIPGSSGSHSFIVRGKGERQSFQSCSHGAGRCMSATKAVANLDLQKEIDHLNEMGVVHNVSKEADLEQVAGSYKDINRVIHLQEDLIDVVTELRPILSIKMKGEITCYRGGKKYTV